MGDNPTTDYLEFTNIYQIILKDFSNSMTKHNFGSQTQNYTNVDLKSYISNITTFQIWNKSMYTIKYKTNDTENTIPTGWMISPVINVDDIEYIKYGNNHPYTMTFGQPVSNLIRIEEGNKVNFFSKVESTTPVLTVDLDDIPDQSDVSKKDIDIDFSSLNLDSNILIENKLSSIDIEIKTTSEVINIAAGATGATSTSIPVSTIDKLIWEIDGVSYKINNNVITATGINNTIEIATGNILKIYDANSILTSFNLDIQGARNMNIDFTSFTFDDLSSVTLKNTFGQEISYLINNLAVILVINHSHNINLTHLESILWDSSYRVNNAAPCFFPDTLIKTSDGLKEIQDLKRGDLLITENGQVPLTKLMVTHTKGHYDFVKFPAHCFALNCPEKDTYCTKPHPVGVNFKQVPASEFVGKVRGVEIVTKECDNFYNIQFDTAEWMNIQGMMFTSHHPQHEILPLKYDEYLSKSNIRQGKLRETLFNFHEVRDELISISC